MIQVRLMNKAIPKSQHYRICILCAVSVLLFLCTVPISHSEAFGNDTVTRCLFGSTTPESETAESSTSEPKRFFDVNTSPLSRGSLSNKQPHDDKAGLPTEMATAGLLESTVLILEDFGQFRTFVFLSTSCDRAPPQSQMKVATLKSSHLAKLV